MIMKMDNVKDDENMIDDLDSMGAMGPYVKGGGKRVTNGHEQKRNIMTMEDVIEELKKDFDEEIEDAKKYMHMSKAAEMANDTIARAYLAEIAKDEYTHAKYIKSFLDDYDVDITEEQKDKLHALKSKLRKFFQD